MARRFVLATVVAVLLAVSFPAGKLMLANGTEFEQPKLYGLVANATEFEMPQILQPIV